MKTKYIKNNQNRTFDFGTMILLANSNLEIEKLDFDYLKNHKKKIISFSDLGYISFVVDDYTTISVDDFYKELEENNLINNENNLFSDTKDSEILSLKEELKIKDNEILVLNENIKEHKEYVNSLINLIKYELEDEDITVDDLKVYANINNIDIGNKTAKSSILKVINESINS